MKAVNSDPQRNELKSMANDAMCRLLEPLENEMERVCPDRASSKTFLSKLLLSIGIEDNDHLYVDGDCDGSLPHRQYAKKLAQEAADCASEDPNLLDGLGMALIQVGEYEAALRCYNRQVHLVSETGYAHNNIAWCQVRLGMAEQAMEACQKALAQVSEHSYFHHDHASILFRLGRLDEALPVIENAIHNLKPKAPQLHYLKACVLEKQGRKPEAVAAWKTYCKEVKSCPGHHRAVERAFSHLASLSHGWSNWGRNRLLTRVRPSQICVRPIWEFVGLHLVDEKQFHPNGDQWKSDIATAAAKKGWKLLQRQRYSAARRKCDEALRVWPFSGLGRVLRARLALHEKDYAMYAKYVTLANLEQVVPPIGNPRCQAVGEFVFFMILVHAEKAYHDGDYDAAIKQLDEVHRDYPNDPMVLFLRGLILAAKGQKEKAKSLVAGLRGDQVAADALLRACRDEIPRMSASASSPISSGPVFGSGSRFGRW